MYINIYVLHHNKPSTLIYSKKTNISAVKKIFRKLSFTLINEQVCTILKCNNTKLILYTIEMFKQSIYLIHFWMHVTDNRPALCG